MLWVQDLQYALFSQYCTIAVEHGVIVAVIVIALFIFTRF